MHDCRPGRRPFCRENIFTEKIMEVGDAQKDMAMATLGAIIAMLLTAAINVSLQRDFARELAESLRVKRQAPLGEEEIARMLRERREQEESGDDRQC
jgi:putative membrane protein